MALLYSILTFNSAYWDRRVRHAEAIVFAATAMFNCRSVFVLGTWRCHAPIASVPPRAIFLAIRAA